MKNIFWKILSILFNKFYCKYIFVISYLYTYLADRRMFKFYDILSSGNALGARSQPWRGYHILRVLKKYRPKQIAEMGSGTSTGVFASYANHHNARLITYEQTREWHEMTTDALRKAGLESDKISIELIPSEESDKGSKFITKIDKSSDFVYIDGPVTVKVNGQKMPCLDIIEFFDRGNYPDVIMVDGRYDTVKAIMAHPTSEKYDVTLEHGMACIDRNLGEFLRFQRHTVFVKRG